MRKTFNIKYCIFISILLFPIFIIISSIYTQKFPVSDFSQDYISAKKILENKSIYSGNLTDLKKITTIKINNTNNKNINFHPPLCSILFIPLTFLSYHNAFLIISLFSILYLTLMCILLSKHYKIPFLKALCILFLSYPFLSQIALGNINFIIIFLLFIIFLLDFFLSSSKYLFKKDLTIGGLLGIAFQIKIFPALLLLYFLFQKRWNILKGFILSNIILFTLTFFIVDFNDIILYYTKISHQDFIEWTNYVFNSSLIIIPISLFGWSFESNYFVSFFNLPSLTIPLYIISSLSIIFYTSYLQLHVKNKASNDIIFSLWLITMCLCSPITWPSMFTLLMIPLFTLVSLKKINKFLIICSILSIIFYFQQFYIWYHKIFNLYFPILSNILPLYGVSSLIFLYTLLVITLKRVEKA